MRVEKYVKIVIENADKSISRDYNELFIKRDKIYPGQVYRLGLLMLLCTCYEIDDELNPVLYCFILLEDAFKRQILSTGVYIRNLTLIHHLKNDINYSKLLDNIDNNNLLKCLKK